jgi:hypothetical protein
MMLRSFADAGRLGVVTADDITQALVKLDHAVNATDIAQGACTNLVPLLRTQWQTWLNGYQAFSAANKHRGFFALGLPAIGDEVVAYSEELAVWSEKIGAVCPNFSPYVSPSDVGGRGDLEIGIGLGVAGLIAVVGGVWYLLRRG